MTAPGVCPGFLRLDNLSSEKPTKNGILLVLCPVQSCGFTYNGVWKEVLTWICRR